MTSAERFAVAMIARLSPPLISGIIIASARIPSSGIWKAMARRVSPERKFEGASALKTTTASKMKAASIVTVGSRPSRSAKEVRVRGGRGGGSFRRHCQWSFFAGAWRRWPWRSR